MCPSSAAFHLGDHGPHPGDGSGVLQDPAGRGVRGPNRPGEAAGQDQRRVRHLQDQVRDRVPGARRRGRRTQVRDVVIHPYPDQLREINNVNVKFLFSHTTV